MEGEISNHRILDFTRFGINCEQNYLIIFRTLYKMIMRFFPPEFEFYHTVYVG